MGEAGAVEVVGVLVGDEHPGGAVQPRGAAGRQGHERVVAAPAAEQLEAGEGARSGEHRVDQESVLAEGQQHGGVAEVADLHGGEAECGGCKNG